MIEKKSHIDDNFIPEGLEFREEYMHTALGNYRRQKRAILWRRMGVAAMILISVTSVFLSLPDNKVSNALAEKQTTKSTIEQRTSSTDSSTTINLNEDRNTLYKNRQSPAVESLEATQDQSTKAVDRGDPMSSGVGLPGQLSPLRSNLQGKSQPSSQTISQSTEAIASNEFETGNANNNQLFTVEPQENQGQKRNSPPSDIPYLTAELLKAETQLAEHKPLPQLPIKRWSLFASLGTKLWADYGFGSGLAQLDPIIGLGIDYKWRKKMRYYLAGQFFTVSGVAAPYVSTQRQYGEGFSETTYSYHTDRFYHTGLSLGASYRLSTKHSVSMFTEGSVLVTTDNRIETGTSSSYESRAASEVKARGYVQGFRSLQQSVGLGYEYALGRNKSVGASYRHGLTDITVNSFFGNAVNRNSMLSFYFKLKLTR